MSKSIKITIDKIGRPKLEAEGFTGSSCMEATQGYLDKFSVAGGEAPAIEHKPEYDDITAEEDDSLQQTI